MDTTIVCTKCGVGTDFYANSGQVCKACRKKYAKATKEDPHKYALRLYHSRWSTVRRKTAHSRATYVSFSKTEFLTWLLDQPKYFELFEEFKASGYKRLKSPSIDRIDASKGYSIDNIQLVLFKDNIAKAFYDTVQTPQKNNTSGVTGVQYVKKSDCWVAKIHHNNNRYHLGSFATHEEAVAARKEGEQMRREGIPFKVPPMSMLKYKQTNMYK